VRLTQTYSAKGIYAKIQQIFEYALQQGHSKRQAGIVLLFQGHAKAGGHVFPKQLNSIKRLRLRSSNKEVVGSAQRL